MAAPCDWLISLCMSVWGVCACVGGRGGGGGLCTHTSSSPQKSTDEQLPHKLLITSVNASCHLQWCNDHENCDLDLWKAIM